MADMHTYRVVFTNGEKREFTVDADHLKLPAGKEKDHYVFMKEGLKVAVIPTDRILYVRMIEKE